MEALRSRLIAHGQGHVLDYWDELESMRREALVAQLSGIDLAELNRLFQRRGEASAVPSRIEPVSIVSHHEVDHRELGEEALRRGEVAALLVAGGQGTRLGFDQPKGMYPVGPISGKTLFQLFAEKVLALSRQYDASVPLLVMTSPATHDATEAYFAGMKYFGLPRKDVRFFRQGTMPALDAETGRLLMETPGSLFLSPDGHGGTLTALAQSGLLAELQSRGVRSIFYFQVDNPLVKVCDPVFLGQHLARRSEASSKCVAKRNAAERAGVFAVVDGRCTIIEYSDLPRSLAEEVLADGSLRLGAASPAIHLFDVDFLERMTSGDGLPFHVARKKVPHMGDPEPTRENGLKFERFVFDVLPRAERWMVMSTPREEEFAPLKNAMGEDSPATVRAAMLADATQRLRNAGAEPVGEVEVSPLFSLDKVQGRQVKGYLS